MKCDGIYYEKRYQSDSGSHAFNRVRRRKPRAKAYSGIDIQFVSSIDWQYKP